MSEFVRIDTGNGLAASVSKSYYDGLAEKPALIDGPAVDGRGNPLRPTRLNGRRVKPRTTVEKEAGKKSATSTTNSGVAAESKE